MPGAGHNRGERTGFDVIVMAASFGGPASLSAVIRALPADLPAAVLVIQHRTPAIDSAFTAALQRRARLPVQQARDGQPVETPGITVLPARHTATIDDGHLRVRATDAIRTADPLMISAAESYGPRAIAAVLTGRLDDGAAGIRAVKSHGGRTLVEDPRTAIAGAMPAAALSTGCVDLVLPLAFIPHALVALTMAPGAADLFRVPAASWAQFVA